MWYLVGVPVVERNAALVVSGFLFTGLAVLAVWLRVFTRAFLVKNMGIDDYFIVASMVNCFYFHLIIPTVMLTPVVWHSSVPYISCISSVQRDRTPYQEYRLTIYRNKIRPR